MKRATLVTIAILGLLAWGTGQADAGLVGTSVTGSLTFEPDFGPTNFYDPANGFVPAGYLNAAGTTVTISASAIEFGFQSSVATVTSDFTDSTLTITNLETTTTTFVPYQFSFTDAAFAGLTLTKLSDTWDNGGVSGMLSGTTLSITWAGGPATAGNSMSAEFSLVGATAAPEPASLIPLGLGMAGLAGYRWRQRRAA